VKEEACRPAGEFSLFFSVTSSTVTPNNLFSSLLVVVQVMNTFDVQLKSSVFMSPYKPVTPWLPVANLLCELHISHF